MSINKEIKISDDTNIAFTDIKKEPTNVFSFEFKKGNNIESNVNESEDEVKLEEHHVQAKIIEARVSSESLKWNLTLKSKFLRNQYWIICLFF